MQVRHFTAEQWTELRDLRLRALAEAPAAFGSTLADALALPESEWRSRAADSEAGTARRTFVAEVNGRLCGSAAGIADPEAPDDVALVGMWVEPAARGAGVGRALVEAVAAWAADTGRQRLVLWVVEENAAARALYRHAGFQETGACEPLASRPESISLEMARRISPSAR